MRATLMVFLSPGFDQLFGFAQCLEPTHVQAFISECSVERFDKRVVRRLPGA